MSAEEFERHFADCIMSGYGEQRANERHAQQCAVAIFARTGKWVDESLFLPANDRPEQTIEDWFRTHGGTL